MKPFFISLTIATAFLSISPTSASAQSPCDPAPSGLVSWWAGEGNTLDQISGYNGTLIGNASYGLGEVGQGVVLNGSGEGVSVASGANLWLQNLTIETWLKRTSASTVSYGSGGNGTIFGYGPGGYYFGIDSSGTLFFCQLGNFALVTGPAITDTNFHHVAVSKNGSSIIFYLDGGVYPAPAYNPTFTFTGAAGIGYRPDNGDNSFYGVVDELSIYSRALSQSEIQGIYNAGSGGKCFTPVGPVITSQPTNQTVYLGQPASFTVAASGTPPFSYQWTFNTTNIAGATNATLALTSLQLTNAGLYRVAVSNAVTSVLSSNAVLTVNPLPPCDPPPAGLVSWWQAEGNAFDQIGGNNGTLIGNASYGTGEVGQGFVFNGNGQGVQLAGATNLWLQNLTIETWVKRASASTVSYGSGGNGSIFSYGSGGGNGGYAFFMDNAGELILSQYGNPTYLIGPAITDTGFHHVAMTKTGGTVVFYVDGVAYPAPAFNTTFTFTGPAGIGYRPDNGDNSFYGVIDELSVYNRALSQSEIQGIYSAGIGGKCFSPAPFIITQPTNETVVVGQSASFTVLAGGTPPLSYQWRFNTTNIVGATNATLNLPNAQFTNAGIYAVLVSNVVNSILSSNAVLSFIPPPTCDPPPAGLVSWWRAEGDTIDSLGINNGSPIGSLTYTNGEVGQAFRLDGASSYVLINNSPSLNPAGGFSIESWIFPNQDLPQSLIFSKWGDQGAYDNNRSYEFSTISGLGLQFAISDLANQANGAFQSFNVYNVLTLNAWNHVVATYDSTSGIRCIFVNGVNVGSRTNTPTAIYNSIVPGAIGALVRAPGASQFFFPGLIDEVSLYNRALSASEIQTIYNSGNSGKCFSPAPIIITQPTNETVVVGQSASFIVLAGGTPPLSYQWSFNTTNIVGATNATLNLPSAQFTNVGIYAVLVSNVVNSILSSNAVLTVNPLPPCDPPPAGLVSWWQAEGNAFDQIGGNNGTLIGNASYGPGEVGQGFVFNGNGQGVQLAGATNLWLQNLTIETWVKRASASTVSYGSGGNGSIFSYGSGGGNGGYAFFMDNAGELILSQYGNPTYLIGPAITDTGFHHVAMTKTGGTVVFYVDGVAYPAPAFNTTFTFTGPAGIGYRPDNGDNSFYGVIDELSVYNRALSQSEIQGIYFANSTGKCPPPPHTATATATLAGVFVVGANITNGGGGYTNTPAVHIVGGGGSGATAVAVVSNGVVVTINITAAGYGYTNAPQIVIDPPFVPNPVLGIAPMSFLTFSNVTIGGTYQLQQFAFYYWANLPSNFTATNAVYTQMVAGLAGIGDYRLALSPAPAQAFATPQVINGFVVGATVTAGGSGYVTTPAVNIVADAGTNATAVASINGGVVTGINIINAGMGYTNPVSMQIDPPPAAAAYLSRVQPVMRVDSANLAPFYNYQIQFEPHITVTWQNWNGGSFTPNYVTNSQYLFITNGAGYFRLQYVP